MITGLLWGVAGLLPILAFFAWAWATRGISPRRLVWPAMPRLASLDEARERLLAPRMAANKAFYGPLFLVGVIGGAVAISEVGAIGVAFVTCAVTPPLLSAVGTLRAWLAVRGMKA